MTEFICSSNASYIQINSPKLVVATLVSYIISVCGMVVYFRGGRRVEHTPMMCASLFIAFYMDIKRRLTTNPQQQQGHLEATVLPVIPSVVAVERSQCYLSESCIICLSDPPSKACMPCRHACACSKCPFPRDKCPICRATIEAIGDITGEEAL